MYCRMCGRLLPDGNNKFCNSKCREAFYKKYSKAEREFIELQTLRREAGLSDAVSKPRKPYKGKSIAELNREALAMGMTYGKYIEYLENQKGQANGNKHHKNN